MKEYKIEDMTKKIQALKQTATELKRISGGIQAVDRNVDRILASIKMLEINISDVMGII
jgi:prefoldin subunit 5